MKKMVTAHKKVGKQRYRETHGLYFEDFEVGDVFEHRPGRTLTDVDNIWQSLLSLNTHPLHIDAVYAGKTEWKQPLMSSLVTLAIVGGMSLNSTSAKGVANLGWDKIRLTAPVFVGDTIYAESRVLAKRMSKSRKTQGVVSVETKGVKADGTVFMTFERTFLVPLRKHSVDADANY
ncbi:MaoC/PaaZ C-terminal domain-containing protein [Pyxidicoccus xibeiensis]|uniref:MaoC/PaaZ C-terminal domain-containing protein n=1 Tax=Pyxidicoccus xibeiensis TaxID=2906759 RepID=UPI0020A7B174|nr:MaoC/PaaZ C-terminal domain-containing protein [Pyxidicoccus xibeiensis]MCP3144888.1 MaoC family dehydratase [Pyxidicoccus xibeiensis]